MKYRFFNFDVTRGVWLTETVGTRPQKPELLFLFSGFLAREIFDSFSHFSKHFGLYHIPLKVTTKI